MRLDIIAQHLEDEGVAKIGQSLFVNFIPADFDGILLRDWFGGTKIDHEIPGLYVGQFMLITRAKGYRESKSLAESAIAALRTIQDKEFDGVSFVYARPKALPFAYAPSPAQHNEFHTTFDARYFDMGADSA